MPTVIDSLLVELGLDASKFDAAQKKSVEGLRKFDEANQKSAKSSQLGSAGMADGFTKAKNALLGFTAVALGVNGFRDFVNQQVFGNAQLGRTAVLLNMSARELDSWGAAVKSVGGTSEGFEASMQHIAAGIANFKLNGDASQMNVLARLGLSQEAMETGTVGLTHLSAALVDIKNKMGVQTALSLASQLGLDQGTFQFLMQGPDAVRKLHDQYYALSGVNQKNIEDAQRLQNKWALLKQASSSLSESLFHEAAPALDAVTDALTRNFTASAKQIAQMGLIPSAEKNYSEWVHDFWHGKSAGSREQSGSVTGGVTGGTGSKLPRNMRNNNPGNIEYGAFAKSHGATGSDGRFAVFPSMEVGAAAQAALLQSYSKQGINTIGGVVSKWSPAGDNGAANTNAYIADVSKRTGIDANQPLSGNQWGAVQQAMAAHEGMTGAKVAADGSGGSNSSSQVETHIGTINVNTQATDANGIAKDMHQTLQQNALISAGTTGNT